MKLNKFDNKKVKIECIDGNTYEGLCSYNSRDYNFHEFGRDEECLQVGVYLFFKNDIEKIKEINEYTSIYGKLEEEIINDIDLIEEILDSEDNEQIIRLLLCIKDNYEEINQKEDLKGLLNTLIKYNKDKEIIKLAKELLSK